VRKATPAGGGAPGVFSLFSVAVVLLDNQRSGVGFEDAENPALMIRFLEQRVDKAMRA